MYLSVYTQLLIRVYRSEGFGECFVTHTYIGLGLRVFS